MMWRQRLPTSRASVTAIPGFGQLLATVRQNVRANHFEAGLHQVGGHRRPHDPQPNHAYRAFSFRVHILPFRRSGPPSRESQRKYPS